MRLRGAVAMLLVVATLVAGSATGCRSTPDEPSQKGKSAQPAVAVQRPATRLPAGEVTVIPGAEAAELALGTSHALFQDAPLVLLAGADDLAGQAAAAPVAVGLGVPLLLTGTPDGLVEELARLDPAAVLAFGVPAVRWAEDWGADVAVVPAPADPVRLADRTGLPPGPTRVVTAGGLGAAVAELRRDRPARLTLPAPTENAAEPPASTGPVRGLGAAATASLPEPPLPPVAAPEPLRSLTVLAPDSAQPVAAIATARAAGARVLVTAATDPRTDPDLITALADQPPGHTLALGDRFGPADRLRSRQAVAATGVQLPGGGQVVFPGRRFVALYGHPGDPVLGVLGEQPAAAALARADQVARAYRRLVDEPVVPALEIITTVASAGPGPAGDYSRRTPVAELRPWLAAARAAGAYVVLDLQPGHTDFLTQAKEYEELLREPHVGLALDPEWRLAPGQRHLAQIGSVDAAEVNQVVDWLADLTARHRLPQKLLVLHQFRLTMITDRSTLDTSRDELAVLIHADGFGTPAQKLNTWSALRADPPPSVWWGWKNFYDEDQPTFTASGTVAISPSPVFISYQ